MIDLAVVVAAAAAAAAVDDDDDEEEGNLTRERKLRNVDSGDELLVKIEDEDERDEHKDCDD